MYCDTTERVHVIDERCLWNICTEAGLFAIRADRDYVLEEDFMKAARKLGDAKKLETKLDYSKV